LLVPTVPALATVIPLDFNTVPLTGIVAGNGLNATAGSPAIQNWLTNALHSAGFATASATVSGALATATYNGEGHVVGETLGTSDGPTPTHHSGNDTFIINDDFGVYGSASHSFTITFTNLTIYALSFDWEIFPDATCALNSWCAGHGPGPTNPNWPDIELFVDGGGTAVWSAQAAMVAGRDPQRLGNSALDFPNGVHTLTFVDWPAEIGVDSISINTCSSTLGNCVSRLNVPEPSPLALAGLALALLALVRWKAPRGRVGTLARRTPQ
jgi:hypothetical protein